MYFSLYPSPGMTAQTPVPPEPWGDRLTLELWASTDKIIHGELSTEERLLKEGQYTISGMIFGFDFVYIPEYAARKVERYFDLTPIESIPWGDPGLRLREVRYEETTMYGLMDYTLSETDRIRLRSWQNTDRDQTEGIGHAPLLDGYEGKIAAIEDGIHYAIRDHLRGRYLNRPREVTGTVVLRRPPRIRTVHGEYEAQVSVYIVIRDVSAYTTF